MEEVVSQASTVPVLASQADPRYDPWSISKNTPPPAEGTIAIDRSSGKEYIYYTNGGWQPTGGPPRGSNQPPDYDPSNISSDRNNGKNYYDNSNGVLYTYYNGEWLTQSEYTEALMRDHSRGRNDSPPDNGDDSKPVDPNDGTSKNPWDDYGPPFIPPRPSSPVKPPKASDPDDKPVDPDPHGPIDTVPDSWGPGIRRNPEEIDLNPSSGLSSIDVNPIGGIVGYNYLGPFTDVKRNLAANVEPANKLDAVAKVHDIAYQRISDLYKNYKISYKEASFMVREADAEFIKSALWLWYDPVAQYSATGIALKNIYEAAMGTRLFVGLRRSGRHRSGLGIGVGMSSNSYTPRVGVRSNSYTPGFRGASRRVPAFDNDRDRNYIPDVFDSYFPRRRRRYY